jgi:hypothetical protein
MHILYFKELRVFIQQLIRISHRVNMHVYPQINFYFTYKFTHIHSCEIRSLYSDESDQRNNIMLNYA